MHNHTGRSSRILLAGLIGFAASASLLAQSSSQPAAGCYSTVKLEKNNNKLSWISSAAYAKDLSRVIVIDPLQNKLFLVATDGTVAPVEDRSLVISPDEMVPATIDSTVDGGFILKMVNQRLLRLKNDLSLAEKLDIGQAKGSNNAIGAVYDWTVAGKYLLAIGSVKINGRHRFGFYRVPLQKISGFDFLRDFTQVDYYLLGNKYLAGRETGGDGFFLAMDNAGVIYRVPASGKPRTLPLKVFPEEYRLIPPLRTVATGLSSDEALFKEIEGLKVPAGLYSGYDGFLYVLTRKPRTDGTGTLWLLHQIDVSKVGREKLTGTIELPTSAPHLTVVLARDNFYILERGSVQALSRQSIESMLIVPSSLITNRSVLAPCQSPTK
jgi:hypothetical protein